MASSSNMSSKNINVNASENKALESLDNEDSFENENYVIVDIGANLTNKKFTRDLDSVVSRAQDAGQYLFILFI